MDPTLEGDVSGGVGMGAAGAVAGVGMAAAQGFMNPISDIMAVVSVVGLGMSLFGSNKASKLAQQESEVAQNIANLDIQVNKQREQQMTLTDSRQKLEIARNVQKQRAASTQAAVNQGAGIYGSGLAGGLAQVSSEGNTGLLNANQNFEIGKNIFGLDYQIDQQRILEAQLQGQSASAQAFSNLGNTITKTGSSPQFANILGMIPGFGPKT